MKTFLWTTLFWIIVAIAGLLCLGFGNLGTQVLDNEWVASIMPKNLQSKFCNYDWVVESALESIDWCAAAEANNCTPAVVESDNENDTELTLADVVANQQVIYSYLQESFADTNQAINSIQLNNIQSEDTVVDEKEQQRLQIQAQIEALQNEMANLY